MRLLVKPDTSARLREATVRGTPPDRGAGVAKTFEHSPSITSPAPERRPDAAGGC